MSSALAALKTQVIAQIRSEQRLELDEDSGWEGLLAEVGLAERGLVEMEPLEVGGDIETVERVIEQIRRCRSRAELEALIAADAQDARLGLGWSEGYARSTYAACMRTLARALGQAAVAA